MVDEDIILDRLNELRRWQEEQRMILVENQLDQQKMLHLEKQKLYEIFGVNGSPNNTSSEKNHDSSSIFNNQDNVTADRENQKCTKNEKELRLQQSAQKINSMVESFGSRVKSGWQLRNDSENSDLPRRSFLKRGEGLKNRFKISPDAFRLNKLPKYKFAKKNTKHAQYNQNLDKKCDLQENTNDAKTVSKVDVTNETVSPEGCPSNAINKTSQGCELKLIRRGLESGTRKYKQEKRSSNDFTPLYREANRSSNEYQNGGIFCLFSTYLVDSRH